MKIAVDLRPLQIGHENRGIGIYLLNILKYLPADAEYVYLRYDSSNPIKKYSLSDGKKYQEVVLRHVRFSRDPAKLLLYMLNLVKPKFTKVKKLKPDIFFQTDYLLGTPRGHSITTAVVAYDLIPLRFRSTYIPSWKKYYHYKQFRVRSRVRLMVRAYYYEKHYERGIRTLRRASKIISISKTTTNDLVNLAKVKQAKIRTVYLAPSFMTTGSLSPSSQIEKIIKPIKGNYLVFIGGTDMRRRAQELVFAFNLLNARGHDMHLVFAGNEFVEDSKQLNPITKKAIETSSYGEKIHLLGKISEEDKLHVLSNAFAFVYPTMFEGFGLPLLEAMKAHCPVITFGNEATIEIARDAAIYPDTADGLGIYSAVINMINDPSISKSIIAKGDLRCKDFSWDKTGKQTVDYLIG